MLPIVQPRLPLRRPFQPRTRHVRRPFHPSCNSGKYRLPNEVRDLLSSALKPFRNRDSAFALATFLARFWSVPGRVADGFPIDRRALADHQELGLTEKRVRSAIRTLEEIGFLDRAIPPSGSRYKATEDGLHRKPIVYVFGSEYAPAFIAANKRTRAARGARSGGRRGLTPTDTPRLSTRLPEDQPLNGPKSKTSEADRVFMGPFVKESGLPPFASETNSKLEAALDRLLQGFRQSRSG